MPSDIVRLSKDSADFVIDNVPSASSNARLLEDFMLQADYLPDIKDPLLRSYSSDLIIEKELEPAARLDGSGSISTHNHITFLHIETLAVSVPSSPLNFGMLTTDRLSQGIRVLQARRTKMRVLRLDTPMTTSSSKPNARAFPSQSS